MEQMEFKNQQRSRWT